MRSDARTENRVNLADVEGYHCGDYNQYMVFTSDRGTVTGEDYKLSDGTLPKMYGIEVETQNWGINSQIIYANVLRDIIFKLFPSNLWKMERDSTLASGCDSYAECITQPMTKAFIRNHYKDFKTMFDVYFPNFGISCSRTGACGMHIHISLSCFGRDKRTQDIAIRKLYYIVNKHYDFMLPLLYRKQRNTNWCGRMDYRIAKTMDLERMPSSHGNCFNGSHYAEGNIELRLVGGQKDFPCFRNTMESVFHLMEAIKKLSWDDCDDIVKIFSGCNQYVYDRIKSYVRAEGQITDEQLLKIRETVKTEELI